MKRYVTALTGGLLALSTAAAMASMAVTASTATTASTASTASTATPTAPTATTAERPISLERPPARLGGVLDTPARPPTAVVLIIPGSGPTDHDGNSPPRLLAQPYKLLANALVADGMAVARIDKRGMALSGSPDVDGNKVTIGMYADDVTGWADSLTKELAVPCIWLLGHSEGSLVAEVAARHPAHVCGLVLVSGPGEPIGKTLSTQVHTQLEGSPHAGALPAFDSAIDQLATGHHVDPTTLPTFLQPLVRPEVQDYLIDLFHYDPAAELKPYRGRVLIISGGNDLQVSTADGQRLKAASPQAKLVVVEGMNHAWKQAPIDRAGNIATYGNPDLPLSPGLASSIVEFIKAGK